MSSEEIELKKGQKRYLQGIVNKFNEDADKAFKDIEKLKKQLIEGSDEIYSYEEIENLKNEIAELHDFILKEDENGETIKDVLSDFKKLPIQN